MWRLDRNLALAKQGDLNFSVSLGVDHRSVRVLSGEDRELATLWTMPQLAKQPLVDAYVRDDDLVCLLAPTESFPFHAQLYWTLGPATSVAPTAVSLSLMVALRTDLLDTQPSIEVVTTVEQNQPREVQVVGGPAYACSLSESMQMIDFATPRDCESQQLAAMEGQSATIERRLFGHFLEKGVIRNGRLFAAFAVVSPSGSEWSDQNVLKACDDFLSTELPLTT